MVFHQSDPKELRFGSKANEVNNEGHYVREVYDILYSLSSFS